MTHNFKRYVYGFMRVCYQIENQLLSNDDNDLSRNKKMVSVAQFTAVRVFINLTSLWWVIKANLLISLSSHIAHFWANRIEQYFKWNRIHLRICILQIFHREYFSCELCVYALNKPLILIPSISIAEIHEMNSIK